VGGALKALTYHFDAAGHASLTVLTKDNTPEHVTFQQMPHKTMEPFRKLLGGGAFAYWLTPKNTLPLTETQQELLFPSDTAITSVFDKIGHMEKEGIPDGAHSILRLYRRYFEPLQLEAVLPPLGDIGQLTDALGGMLPEVSDGAGMHLFDMLQEEVLLEGTGEAQESTDEEWMARWKEILGEESTADQGGDQRKSRHRKQCGAKDSCPGGQVRLYRCHEGHDVCVACFVRQVCVHTKTMDRFCETFPGSSLHLPPLLCPGPECGQCLAPVFVTAHLRSHNSELLGKWLQSRSKFIHASNMKES